ncbi:MAG: lipoyl synthase [Bacteroidales bacterium]|nr:lipoyl synthase [Bacteroidales bacterium]
MSKLKKKPDWLKTKLPTGENYLRVKETIKKHNLHTICTSGKCPNLGECWGSGTATFMILGNICTRSCKFCATETGIPKPVDKNEPKKVANSVKLLKLNHCVITSVDRDDLDDGGAHIWAETIRQIKNENPDTTIEVLIPDFNGKTSSIDLIINEKPNIISHNLETVRRLTSIIRSNAEYDRSLNIIKYISRSGIKSKSGIMVGLGETENEIYDTMKDLISVGCKILTIGQYLQPTLNHRPVKKYITPKQFEKFKEIGTNMGFDYIESGPLVRSSYHAEKHI